MTAEPKPKLEQELKPRDTITHKKRRPQVCASLFAMISHFVFPVHLRQVSARSSFSTVRGSNRMTLQAN